MEDILGVAKIPNIYLGCLKFLIYIYIFFFFCGGGGGGGGEQKMLGPSLHIYI